MKDYDVDSIVVLSFCESVRKRPGMYFGNISDGSAVIHVMEELVSNVVDLYLSGLATEVRVCLHHEFFEVIDDGPGLPFEQELDGACLATQMMSVPHFTPSLYEKAPHIHLHQSHGVGIAAVLAASRRFECWSWRDGELWFQAFEQGVQCADAVIVEVGEGQGTRMRVCLDDELFAHPQPSHSMVRERLWEAVHLFPGLRAWVNDEPLFAPRGLLNWAMQAHEMSDEERLQWGARPGFFIDQKTPTFGIHAAVFGYASEPGWYSWLNGIRTRAHGIHQQGLANVLESLDWSPSIALLSITGRAPRYAGPTRDEAVHVEAWDQIEDVLREALTRYCRGHDI